MSKDKNLFPQEDSVSTVFVDETQNTTQQTRLLYIESYGCQMNFSDSEIVASILQKDNFKITQNHDNADVIFLNTCAIRENAEQRIRQRLKEFTKLKQSKPETVIGILGCMAERLKSKFLEEEKIVDLVAGPDAYKDLPNLIEQVNEGSRAINVLLSREETYADINPVRLNSNGISAFISIMRGCDNMCTFCVVPFTRGRERSRDPQSIVAEAENLFQNGYREVTLLGQNVDSYKWKNESGEMLCDFAQLLEKVAQVSPLLRVRFSTSHPKDMTDEVLHTIAKYPNICKYIHLPVQSGSSEILEKMRRGYSREWYFNRIDCIHKIVPDCAVSTDIITGFCSETDADHELTLTLMDRVKYDFAYMFKYSERPGTPAAKKFEDDISEEIKTVRLQEVIAKQRLHSEERMQQYVGKTYEVLIEGTSKKSEHDFFGRTSQNAVAVFPKAEHYKKGDYVNVFIESCTSATLLGKVTEVIA